MMVLVLRLTPQLFNPVELDLKLAAGAEDTLKLGRSGDHSRRRILLGPTLVIQLGTSSVVHHEWSMHREPKQLIAYLGCSGLLR